MYLVYQFAKVLVWISLRLYYPKATVLHPERLKFDHPAIVTSNHPNTLLDVLHVAYRTKKQVFFLANASMFASTLGNWFFSNFYCIPIKRQKDNNSKINNEDSFARCNDFLGNGGCLYIAPEGVSVMQRGLRPIKKGAARIALSAENQHNFQLGLKIVPVGLTYDKPNFFRSRLVVNVAEPIDISSFQTLYQKNPSEAATAITELMEQRLKANVINPTDEQEDHLLNLVEEIAFNENPPTGLAAYEQSKVLLQQLQEQKVQHPDTFALWKQNMTTYFNTLKQLKTNDKAVVNTRNKISLFKNVLLLILGLPFFLYGSLNNIFPVLSTLAMTRKVNAYVGYNSTIKILAGLFIFFPIFYGLQTYAVYQFSHSTLWTILYFASLIPMGLVAWEYGLVAKQTLKTWRFKQFLKQKPLKAESIFEQRKKLNSFIKTKNKKHVITKNQFSK